MNLSPVTLTGRFVRLIPLSLDHIPELTAAGQDESIWTFMRYGVINSEEKMRAFVEKLLNNQANGKDLPFTVTLKDTGRIVGMSRLMDIQQENRSLEIGGTWYAPAYQRTGVNTESKYLLLKYAFETLGVIRVQLKTDLRNERSQRAIERIGAVREGVLRNHIILPDGTIRSSVFYSILDTEWPAVKIHFEEKINKQ